MAEQSMHICGLCRKNYDGLTHKPLSLPCGDVFCEDCLTRLGRGEDSRCPVHQIKIVRSHKDLPVCQPLFKSLSPQRSSTLCCSAHPQKRVKYRCVLHEKFLCTLCIIPHTGAGHLVERFEATLQSARQQSEDLRKLANSRTTTLFDIRKRVEAEERSIKCHYELQVRAVHTAYDEVVSALNAKRKTHVGILKDALTQHLSVLEQEKAKLAKMSEATATVISKLNKLSLESPLEDVVRMLCELQRDSKRFEDCKCPDMSPLVFTPALSLCDNCTLLPKTLDATKVKSGTRGEVLGTLKTCSPPSPQDSLPSCVSKTPREDASMEATIPLFGKSERSKKAWDTLPKQHCDKSHMETLKRGHTHRRSGRRRRNNSL